MKTSPRIQSGPLGGGMSIPMKPLTQTVFLPCVTCKARMVTCDHMVPISLKVSWINTATAHTYSPRVYTCLGVVHSFCLLASG